MALIPWHCIPAELLRMIAAEPDKSEWTHTTPAWNTVVAKAFRVEGKLVRVDFFWNDEG